MIQSYPLPKRKEEFETLLCMDININQYTVYTLWKFLLSANERLPQFIKRALVSFIKEAAITKSLSNIWIDIEKVTSEAIHEKLAY